MTKMVHLLVDERLDYRSWDEDGFPIGQPPREVPGGAMSVNWFGRWPALPSPSPKAEPAANPQLAPVALASPPKPRPVVQVSTRAMPPRRR